MTLENWRKKNGLTLAEVARKINGCAYSTLHRYATGRRLPPQHVIDEIEALTEGKVKGIDFWRVYDARRRTEAAAA